MDHLDSIRVFVAVAQCGSFAGAARRLRMSPSVATRAVAQLEERLAVTLFHRTTRSVRLTDAGAAHLERCIRVIADLDEAERALRGGAAEPRGEMVIAAPIVFGRLHVLPIVTALLRRHAALSVRLVLSDRNAHLAEEGIDVAIRIGELADSSLVARKLGVVRHVVVASPEYLARRPPLERPADLAAHDIVVFEGLGSVSEWQFQTGAVRIQPRLSVTTAEAAIDAAASGVGITRAFSYQVGDALQAGRLVELLTAFGPPDAPVSALFQAGRSATASVAAFLAEASARFPQSQL